MMIRRTLAKEVSKTFRGMFGENTISISPVHKPQGIIFKYHRGVIPATLEHVRSDTRMITLGNRFHNIYVVEHLLAALVACEITDCLIEVSRPVIPSLRMGMLDYILMIKEGGWKGLKEAMYYKSLAHDSFTEGDRVVEMETSKDLIVHYIIDFPNSIGFQEHTFQLGKNSPFEIASARPYRELNGFSEMMIKPFMPALRDTFLFASHNGFINQPADGDDEPVRHKTIDFLGALALLGHPVRARFNLYKSGHAIDVAALRQFLRLGHLHLTNAL